MDLLIDPVIGDMQREHEQAIRAAGCGAAAGSS